MPRDAAGAPVIYRRRPESEAQGMAHSQFNPASARLRVRKSTLALTRLRPCGRNIRLDNTRPPCPALPSPGSRRPRRALRPRLSVLIRPCARRPCYSAQFRRAFSRSIETPWACPCQLTVY